MVLYIGGCDNDHAWEPFFCGPGNPYRDENLQIAKKTAWPSVSLGSSSCCKEDWPARQFARVTVQEELPADRAAALQLAVGGASQSHIESSLKIEHLSILIWVYLSRLANAWCVAPQTCVHHCVMKITEAELKYSVSQHLVNLSFRVMSHEYEDQAGGDLHVCEEQIRRKPLLPTACSSQRVQSTEN